VGRGAEPTVRMELRVEGRTWESHHRKPTRETTSPPSPESSACCACSSITFLPVLNWYTFTAFLFWLRQEEAGLPCATKACQPTAWRNRAASQARDVHIIPQADRPRNMALADSASNHPAGRCLDRLNGSAVIWMDIFLQADYGCLIRSSTNWTLIVRCCWKIRDCVLAVSIRLQLPGQRTWTAVFVPVVSPQTTLPAALG